MALSLALAMGLSLAACGDDSNDETTTAAPAEETTTAAPADDNDATDEDTEEPAAPAEADFSNDGKVLNIYVWNDEFANRLKDYYPGYEANDPDNALAGGKIGDITVNFTQTPSDDNAYQNKLDTDLPKNASAADDDKIDMYLVEADYALKYVDTDYAMPIADLGITDAELANQYQYTKDIMTDSNGVLKGVSWQGCPGVLIYNRAIATEVLGSDDPDAVQEAVKDWATYAETAAKVAEAGYKMTAGPDDSFRVYSDNAATPWVDADGNLSVPASVKDWAEATKELSDNGYIGTGALWGDDWSKGFYPEGGVFCYFGPAWFIDFCMAADDEASIAHAGGWGATVGPQGFSWGGTWIVAEPNTDNPALVADIMRKLTTDKDIMVAIVKGNNDFVNNQPAMEEMAADTSYGDAVLGGQNALALFSDGATKIDRSTMSAYDQGCTEEFQGAMKDWFDGNYASYDEALEAFKTAISEKYPDLTIE